MARLIRARFALVSTATDEPNSGRESDSVFDGIRPRPGDTFFVMVSDTKPVHVAEELRLNADQPRAQQGDEAIEWPLNAALARSQLQVRRRGTHACRAPLAVIAGSGQMQIARSDLSTWEAG